MPGRVGWTPARRRRIRTLGGRAAQVAPEPRPDLRSGLHHGVARGPGQAERPAEPRLLALLWTLSLFREPSGPPDEAGER